jgi:hypothetical protein
VCAVVGFAALIVCGAAAADPPARVARLANIAGPVSFSPAGEDEWAFATPNRPLITGDRVWTDAGARAELQIGALAVRIGSLSSVTILNLDDRVAQFQLAQGVLNVRVRRVDPGQIIEIDTPLLAFRCARPVTIDRCRSRGCGDGGRRQSARATSTARAARRMPRARASGAASPIPHFATTNTMRCPRQTRSTTTRDRDRREDRPVAARYVSPDVMATPT